MRLLILTILFILISLPVQAVTVAWDHDCADTTGFRLYSEGEQIANILCPETTATLGDMSDGSLMVTAYNDYGESERSNIILVLAAYYYNSVRYEYSTSGLILYKGEHTDWDASESDNNWLITKYHYNMGVIVWTQTRTTSWTNRASGW